MKRFQDYYDLEKLKQHLKELLSLIDVLAYPIADSMALVLEGLLMGTGLSPLIPGDMGQCA